MTSLNPAGPIALGGQLVVLPTGGRVGYVYHGGATQDDLPAGMPAATGGFHTSVQAAYAQCRATRGDIIVGLPGHAETVAAADGWSNAVAGVQIIGLGWGSMRPTVTLSAAASDLKLDVANTIIDNFRFVHSAADVTKAFEVSAAHVAFKRCYIQASDAANKMTTVMRLSSGADDFLMEDCQVIGGATALTDTCLINAAVARPIWRRCHFAAALGTTEGLLTFATAAATRIRIEECILENTVTSSTVALKTLASMTGVVIDTRLGVTVADAGGVAAAAWNTKGNLTGYNVTAATLGLGGLTAITATQ